MSTTNRPEYRLLVKAGGIPGSNLDAESYEKLFNKSLIAMQTVQDWFSINISRKIYCELNELPD